MRKKWRSPAGLTEEEQVRWYRSKRLPIPPELRHHIVAPVVPKPKPPPPPPKPPSLPEEPALPALAHWTSDKDHMLLKARAQAPASWDATALRAGRLLGESITGTQALERWQEVIALLENDLRRTMDHVIVAERRRKSRLYAHYHD